MVGGDEATFNRALPVFEAFGGKIRLCGGVGAGQVIKLVNQYLVAVHTLAASEAAAFAVQLGADLTTVQDVIGTSFGSSAMLLRNLPRYMARDFSPATPVGLIAKDLSIIHCEAETAGVPLLLGGLVEQYYLEAKARGWTGEDMAALVKFWDRQPTRGNNRAPDMPRSRQPHDALAGPRALRAVRCRGGGRVHARRDALSARARRRSPRGHTRDPRS